MKKIKILKRKQKLILYQNVFKITNTNSLESGIFGKFLDGSVFSSPNLQLIISDLWNDKDSPLWDEGDIIEIRITLKNIKP